MSYFSNGARPAALLLILLSCVGCNSVQRGSQVGLEDLIESDDHIGPASADPLWILVRDDAHTASGGSCFSGALRDPENPAWRAEPRNLNVSADVLGRLVSVQLQSEYLLEVDRSIELEYELTLPRDAAIDEFTVKIGDRHIRAILRERQQAQRIYAAALRSGLLATLLTQSEDGVFRQRLGVVDGRSELELSLHYSHAVAWRDGWCELSLPGPSSSETEAQLVVELDAGVPILSIGTSEGARATVTSTALARVNAATPSWQAGEPCHIHWQVDTEMPSAVLYRQPDVDAGDDYFMLMTYGVDSESPDWDSWKAHSVHVQRTGTASLAVGRLPKGRAAESLAGAFETDVQVEIGREVSEDVSRLWVRAEVGVLMERLLRSKSFAEKARISRAVKALALSHGISSPMTAFLMVSAR